MLHIKKTLVSIFVALVLSLNLNAQNQASNCNDSLVLNELLKINIKKYKGKPVDKFLNEIECTPIKISFIEMKPMSIAWGRIKYSNDVWIDIFIDDYKVMKKELDPGESPDVWKEEDFRKEIISKIRVVKKLKTLKQYPKKPALPNI